jgi:hypothetical protein
VPEKQQAPVVRDVGESFVDEGVHGRLLGERMG